MRSKASTPCLSGRHSGEERRHPACHSRLAVTACRLQIVWAPSLAICILYGLVVPGRVTLLPCIAVCTANRHLGIATTSDKCIECSMLVNNVRRVPLTRLGRLSVASSCRNQLPSHSGAFECNTVLQRSALYTVQDAQHLHLCIWGGGGSASVRTQHIMPYDGLVSQACVFGCPDAVCVPEVHISVHHGICPTACLPLGSPVFAEQRTLRRLKKRPRLKHARRQHGIHSWQTM